MHHAFSGKLRDCVGTPKCAPLTAHTRGSKQNRGIRRLLQHRHQRLGHLKLSCNIYLHYPVPHILPIVAQGGALAQYGGIVQQAIQTAKLLVKVQSQLIIVLSGSPLQIHRINHRLSTASDHYLVKYLLQLGQSSARQYHFCAQRGTADSRGLAYAISGTGNQNNAVLQQVGAGLVGDNLFWAEHRAFLSQYES